METKDSMGKNSPQLNVGTFIGERGWKYLAGSRVDSNTVNDGPISVASYCGIKFAYTCLRQINFHRMLVKGFCEGLEN